MTTTETGIDPAAFLRDIERAWQARDGEAAAAGYSDDAVLVYGNGQRRSGEELRAWPQQWFDFASDLQIKKTLRAFSGDCLAGEWESRYTHPQTGSTMLERGAEFFWIRDGKVYLHHMFEHTWPEGEGDATWPAV
jgi:ketosteroid isomerase-like protein